MIKNVKYALKIQNVFPKSMCNQVLYQTTDTGLGKIDPKKYYHVNTLIYKRAIYQYPNKIKNAFSNVKKDIRGIFVLNANKII